MRIMQTTLSALCALALAACGTFGRMAGGHERAKPSEGKGELAGGPSERTATRPEGRKGSEGAPAEPDPRKGESAPKEADDAP